MQGSIRLSLGGYSIVFAGTLLLLVVILLSLFFYRQIRRFQNNRARKAVNTTVAAELSKKSRQLIAKKVDEVFAFRSCHFPSFTDCRLISEHANLPHVHRMIACDEVLRDVDRQLEAVNADLVRCPGESTYSFLNRIKAMDIIPELSDDFVERLSFLHEWSRLRCQPPFGEEELAETRALLKEFLRFLNKNQNALTALNNLKGKSRSLEAKPSNLGFRVASTKGSSLPERVTFQEQIPLLQADQSSPSDSPRHSVCK